MHASETLGTAGSRLGKIAVVAGLHLILIWAALSMNMIVKDKAPHEAVTLVNVDAPLTTEPETVAPTEAPPPSTPNLLTVPDIEIDIALPPPATSVTAVTAVTPPPATTVAGGNSGGNGTLPAATEKKAIFAAALANAGDCALPEYPARAARNGEEGVVTLALLIGIDGKVSDAKVQRTSGYRDLDRAAIAALSMCKFKPASTNGVPEPAWGNIAYAWKLN